VPPDEELDRFGHPVRLELAQGAGSGSSDLRTSGRAILGGGAHRWPAIVHEAHGSDMPLQEEVEALRRARRPRMVLEPDPGRARRVALVPGSFDPITVAHAALADAVGPWADIVVMVYSVRTVPKESGAEPPLLSEDERLRALQMFSRSRPNTVLGVCSHGLLVEQVRAARDRFPEAELRMVIGSDKVIQLLDPSWYADRDVSLDGLFRESRVVFGARGGELQAVQALLAARPNLPWRDRFERVDLPPGVAPVSSREVRSKRRRGEDVRHLVPASVLALIAGVGAGPAGE